MSGEKSNTKKITIISIIILAIVCIFATVVFLKDRGTTEAVDKIGANSQQAETEEVNNDEENNNTTEVSQQNTQQSTEQTTTNEQNNVSQSEQQSNPTNNTEIGVTTATTTTTTTQPTDATTVVTQTVETTDVENVDLKWQALQKTEIGDLNITVIKPNLQNKLDVKKEVVDFNEIVEYSITVSNQGNIDANKVIVSDIIPEGTTFSYASDSGEYNNETKQIIWKLDINQNETKTLTVIVVNNNKDGIILNQAVVDGEETNLVEVTVQDMIAPDLIVDTIDENGYSNTQNPQIHATDQNPFTVTVKLNGEVVRTDEAHKNEDGTYGTWFGIEYLEDGEYEVTATDVAGNVSTKTFILDRKVPDLVVDTINENGYSNTQNPQIHATDQNPFTVTVKLNGEVVRTDEAHKNEDGTYGTWFGIEYLEDGEYEVTATDKAGNVSTKTFILDRKAPDLVVDTINENGYSNTQNPQIHATDQNPFTVTVKLNGEVVRTDEAHKNEDGTYSTWFGIDYLEDGEYEVTATDVAGNVSTKTFILDRKAPVATNIEIMNIDQVTPGYAKAGDRIWVLVSFEEKLGTNPVITINGVKAENVNIHDKDETRNYYQYMGEVVMTEGMPEGVIKFTVNGYKDIVGNEGKELTNADISYGDTREIILDYTAPEITFDNIVDGVIKQGTSKEIVDKNPFSSVVTREDGTIVTQRGYRDDRKADGSYWDRFNIGWLGEGTFTVTATDAAGNVTTKTFKVDGTAPVATDVEIMNIDQVTPGYAKAGDRIWVLATFKEKLGTIPVITINGVKAENVRIHNHAEGSPYYQYMGEVIMTEDMPEGVIKFTVNGYKDIVGNEGKELTNTDISYGVVREIILDTTKPEINVENQVDVVIRDANKFTTNWEKLDSDLSGTSNNDGYWGNAWQTSFSLSWITDNKFTVKVTATDVAGNVATKEWTIDVTAPVCTSLEIENKNQTTGYAKAGDVIKVSVAFNEELVSNPIIKVNNILADVSIIEGKYVGEVEMKADMKQGEIEISVDEYKDDSENLGLELTNDNITGDVKSIILDTIKPVINFDENKASGTIMDTNLDKYLGRILKGTVNDHIDTFAWLKDPEVKFDFSSHGDGVYTIEAYDKAGNVTIEKITQGVVPSSIKVHPVGTMLKQGAQEAQKNVEETEQVKKTEGNLISDNKETTMENEQEETKTNKDSKEEVIENLKGNEEDKSLNKTENVLEELDKKLND